MKNTEKLSGYVTNLTGKRKVHMVFVAKKKNTTLNLQTHMEKH